MPPSGGGLTAVIRNGVEEAPVGEVERRDGQVVFRFPWYDSEIVAELDAEAGRMTGEWRKTVPGGVATLPFAAARGDDRRFLAPASGGGPFGSVAGDWVVEFRDDEGVETARAVFAQKGRDVTGTVLTATGDYRYLAGSFLGGVLRLSTFDGSHAFLFEARAQGDGTLAGDFWSRDSYHATWTARRVEGGEEVLPDPWEQVALTNDEGLLRFTFPDLAGEPVSLADPRFAGKVVLVNLFGSWCPNCNDEAPLLAQWHRKYRDQGLEVVGLAYEYTGDVERDRTVVRRYAERYGIEYPLLLAGTSGKADAAATLPDLTRVAAYPTTIFVGRDGKVRQIHSGFSGPGTGERFERLVVELQGVIEELLAEPAPAAPV